MIPEYAPRRSYARWGQNTPLAGFAGTPPNAHCVRWGKKVTKEITR